ncbi:MAG: CvpA family protein [Firmicutes bacterium]|nr:CvpA family protein [Bacillota bacterium]
MYYFILPPLNAYSRDFWSFIILAIIVVILIFKAEEVRMLGNRADEGAPALELARPFKVPLLMIAAIVGVLIVGGIISSTFLRASAYHQLMPVETGDFSTDISEVDYNQIPVLDKDTAWILAQREMGNMADIVSQYEVSNYITQINYEGKPVRVVPLKYGDPIKWLLNRSTGIPAYIITDMTTQDVELVRLQEGMKISPAEYFNRNLQRFLRFNYPTAMFRNYSFEIDDDGTPYWICAVEEHRIAPFGGIDVKGAVVLNAITGEHIYYPIAEIPSWVDAVYDAKLLVQQYDYYGTLKNGFWNSIFGQKDCLQTTEGFNYIAQDDDVWVYTGVTSVGGDESIVGFMLMNQRTKQSNFYSVVGAKEYSAMSSAEGQVQHLNYVATFPLLLNVGGEPTYFMALKDAAGLVKKYAMVNIQKYQIVAIGDTVAQCDSAYRQLMIDQGISVSDSPSVEKMEATGVVKEIMSIVTGGETYYYLVLENDGNLYGVRVGSNLSVLRINEGDTVTMVYTDEGAEPENGIFVISEIERTAAAPAEAAVS